MTEELSKFTDLDPYEILGLESSASAEEIKKAYRRKALLTHPDKAKNEEEKRSFHTQFQQVAFAYSVLSDEKRKKRYDRTGSLDDIPDDEDMYELFTQLCKGASVSKDQIEADKKEYRESGEEEQDILYFYEEGKGDIDVIFENVPHTEVLEDEDRIREIINTAIKEKKVPAFSKFTKEDASKKKKRKAKARKEAKEAEDLASSLGINREKINSEDELALLIRNRGEQRFNSLIDNLEAKYAPKKKKSKKANK